MVVAPDSIKFAASDSAIYQSTPNPQYKAVNFYVAKNITPKQKVAFEISGKGEMPHEQEQAGSERRTGAESPQAPAAALESQ